MATVSYADVSSDAVRALGICSEKDFSNPSSACYGLAQDLRSNSLNANDVGSDAGIGIEGASHLEVGATGYSVDSEATQSTKAKEVEATSNEFSSLANNDWNAVSESSGGNCSSGVFVVEEGYLSASVERLGEQCGWKVFWHPRRGDRTLDWRVVVAYPVRYSSFRGALEGILSPFGTAIGADIYTDARVIDVKVHEDR